MEETPEKYDDVAHDGSNQAQDTPPFQTDANPHAYGYAPNQNGYWQQTGAATMNGGVFPGSQIPQMPEFPMGFQGTQQFGIPYPQTSYQMSHDPKVAAREGNMVPNGVTDHLQQAASRPSQEQLWEQVEHYSWFDNPARIAIYDDLRSAPRIIQIPGGPTHELIEKIASLTYQHAKEAGGMLPYTVIREVSENFIHADFTEVVVSILDHGNTIRFSDQGPGIKNKELVQQPGFTSATEPMKRFIRGVGSGFPLMEDYLRASKGYYTIEDNVDGGAVITISLMPKHDGPNGAKPRPDVSLTENEKAIMTALLPRLTLGVTELHNATGVANSSIHAALSRLEEAGLLMKENKKRTLTDIGYEIALSL